MSKRKMSLREIDAEIARVLFGWTNLGIGKIPLEPPAGAYYTHEAVMHEMVGQGPCENLYSEVPAYSSDIAAAWGVVEATDLLADDRMLERNDDGEWAVVQTYPYGGGRDTLATAKTAPLAICLAALQHRNIDVEAADA